jgi:hypothetical protein
MTINICRTKECRTKRNDVRNFCKRVNLRVLHKVINPAREDQQIEQEQRLKMKGYAIHDCTVLFELYFHMYPAKGSIYQEISTTSIASTTFKITTMSISWSRIFYINNNDELSDISEDESIEILKPKLDQQPAEPTMTAETTTVTTSSEQKKKERQRRKMKNSSWRKNTIQDSKIKFFDQYIINMIIVKFVHNY